MRRQTTASTTIKLAVTAIFTPLVFIATAMFSISVPQTRGYFNIGETMIYIAAMLFGPFVGAFAGGVGSMLADLFLAPHFALATLIIKACEGGVVGVLAQRRLKFNSPLLWKALTVIFGLIAGVLLGVIGSYYYSGSVELYIGFPPSENPTLNLFVPKEFWYSLGVLVALLISLTGFVFEPEFGWFVFSIFLGGSLMVIGYFLYEQFFLGVLALAEIPVNIGQMTIGLIVALPIVRAIWRSLPSLKG